MRFVGFLRGSMLERGARDSCMPVPFFLDCAENVFPLGVETCLLTFRRIIIWDARRLLEFTWQVLLSLVFPAFAARLAPH